MRESETIVANAVAIDAAAIEGRKSLGELAITDTSKIKGPSFAGNITAPQATSPGALLAMAVDRGASMEQLEKLMALVERHEANEARKAFVAAMSEFKKVAPTIIKDKHVSFTTEKGTTEYDHATLGAICEQVIAKMGEFGLSHSWKSQQEKDGVIRVTCVLRHAAGHVDDDVWLEAKPDGSGGKNGIQAVGSAVSYLQRYTLLMALGLAAKGADDDARRAGEQAAQQAAELAATLVDALLAQLAKTTDDKAALAVWQANNGKLQNNVEQYDRLKDAVVKHRTALRKQKEGASA